jgi:hypothetical protein
MPNGVAIVPGHNCVVCVLCGVMLQEYVNLNNSDSYLMAAGAQALVSSKAGRAAKVSVCMVCLQVPASACQALLCGRFHCCHDFSQLWQKGSYDICADGCSSTAGATCDRPAMMASGPGG